MQYTDFEAFVTASFPGVTRLQLERFAAMDGLYREWNAKINVISRKDIDGLYLHHVLHSLAIAAYLQAERPDEYGLADRKVLDLGTGGGFPGIPLAVLFPEAQFTLCDSVGKKTLVADGVAKALGLENVTVVNARAETLPDRFDYIVSRAVTTLENFYPWVRGRFSEAILYLKGGDVAEETALLMARHRLRRGSVGTWRIDRWADDPYFSEKYVIDIRR